MKVVEIFNSIEGEGKRAGLPTTFIRLFSCNLNCRYCDTRYACVGNDYSIMSIEEIMKAVELFGCPTITVTGGEPLIHAGIDKLLVALVDKGYWVNVETNGSQILPFHRPLLFYTVDYKTNASGMSDKMCSDTFKQLEVGDVLKFVVGSQEDLNQALEFVERYDINPGVSIYVSPVYGKIEPKEIVEFIQCHKLWYWKTQLQMHKYIWNPDERGV